MEKYIDYFSSPLGFLKITANNTHLLELSFNKEINKDSYPNHITNETVKQLRSYFKKELKKFSIPTNPMGSEFRLKVWKILQEIKYGELKSYKDVAIELGSIKYVRAIGLANGDNPIPIIIPCHRVIGSNNNIIGYSGEIWRKRWLLEHENAGFQNSLFAYDNTH